MIKVLYLVKRAEGLTHEEFLSYQLEHHAPLAMRHHPTMRRYVTNPIMPGVTNPASLDTVAELWFDSVEDLEDGRFYDSPEGKRIIMEDNARFCAPGTKRYITQEIVIKDDIDVRPRRYRPGDKVEALGGRVLSGEDWKDLST
jgi:uncharacterized protein (TIGR02118 family)